MGYNITSVQVFMSLIVPDYSKSKDDLVMTEHANEEN